MTSRVDPRLKLSNGGRTVEVTGPIVSWDPDEISATFSVVITQMNEHDQVVTANGASTDLYTRAANSTTWAAVASVTDPALRLEQGPATAFATATILVDGPSY